MSGTKVLRETYSVCPVCRKRIEARQVERDGAVFQEKACLEHGFFSTVVWRGFLDIEAWRKSAAKLTLSCGDECPNACGLCSHHQSGTCCVLLEVTRRCNLRCPYCFADGGDGTDRPFADIVTDIKALAVNGQTLLQLSGGEPTVRDDLPDIIRAAKQAGCRYVQLNTNGVRLAEDFAYLKELKEAGLSFVFMQFDGVDDHVYRALRGQALLEAKKCAMGNCGKLKIGVTLVPTVVPGVNDHQIGDILRFATSQSPNVRGVHFQPVSYFGRTPKQPSDSMRYTLDQLMHDIEVQASDVLPNGSLRPSRCDHPLCGFHGDYLVKPDGTLHSLLAEDGREEQASAAQNRAFVARRWDRSRGLGRARSAGGSDNGSIGVAPEKNGTCCCGDDLPNVTKNACCCESAAVAYAREEEQSGAACCCEDAAKAYVYASVSEKVDQQKEIDLTDMDAFLRRVRTHGFTVTAMAFQDAGNLDLERLKRCSLHVYKDGKFIPFCGHYL